MISKTFVKFVFIIGISSWTVYSTDDDIFSKIPNYVDLCKDDVISLNFSNTKISDIGPDFISSPLIVCLNLTNNYVQRIARNAFKKLPNLTNLFLSNNELDPSQLFNFGGHKKLKVLILNNTAYSGYKTSTTIYGEYPNLEILIARKNSLTDINKELIFQSHVSESNNLFPKLKILDLSENKLISSTFVNFLSNSLQYLNLRNNRISSLHLKEKGENLLVLNMDNNNLNNVQYSDVNSLSLERLKNLRYLSLSGNMIETIASDAFRDINKLSYLNLSTNNIDNLYLDTFTTLQFLNMLDLSNNKLENTPQISNVANISILYLNCNKIERIFSYAFAQTPKLTKLLLGGNQINQIDAKAFINLSVLEELDLSGNKLSSLPKDWTESIVSLKYLDLSNNAFISLESLFLTSALPLTELYLMMNPLRYLDIRYFKNLPQNLTVHLEQKSNFTQHCVKSGQINRANRISNLPVVVLRSST